MDRTIHHTNIDPTDEIYRQLKIPLVHFNETLFNGGLPDCVLTLAHNRKRTLGYFRPGGFRHHDGTITDEIAMNPRIFLCEDLPYILSIIVHEMAHQWKYHHLGPENWKGGYHCKAWGKKMNELGLPPSNTGKPGGKRTGYQMMHYIEKDGAFYKACQSLVAQDFTMQWGFSQQQLIRRNGKGTENKQKNKIKYSCVVCGLNAWAKPNIKLACVECSVLMREIEK
ncbi:MAG: SprT-like domain-containing protein [Candidatus Thiodiazotropha sp.]